MIDKDVTYEQSDYQLPLAHLQHRLYPRPAEAMDENKHMLF